MSMKGIGHALVREDIQSGITVNIQMRSWGSGVLDISYNTVPYFSLLALILAGAN